MYLVLRSFGGFGNQLFQYFFCLNLQQKYKYREVYSTHDSNYEHNFKINESLLIYKDPPKHIKFISDLRLPMILSRIGLYKKGYIKLGKYIFLDSYFQDKDFYSSFRKSDIRHSLEQMRNILGIQKKEARFEDVYHIRLGDFFSSEKDEIDFLKSTLKKMKPNSHIITNRQDLLGIKNIKEKMEIMDLDFLDTDGLDPKDLIERFSVFLNIHSNNSTLAFWAALLYGRNFDAESSKLLELQSIFSQK